jgi:tRNA dimethylallyltransferase
MSIVVAPSSGNNQSVASADQLETAPGAPKIVVIVGPTAVGKTHAGIELALRFDGEVINADSRYLYRGLDIGVAKPNALERQGVPHHLIDVVDPADEMSLATYQQLATAAIAETVGRGHLPILVGGTPLYVNAVVEGWRIPRVAPNRQFRARLEAEAEELGVASLSARLAAVDPIAAERSGSNLRRIIRALEIYETTGLPMSSLEGKGPRPYDTLEIWLTMPREQLHMAIDKRVDDQFEAGLVEEVRALLEGGLSAEAPSMSSLGYRQLIPYLCGEQSLDEAARQIKQDTHRYVRHQETWLRRNPRLVKIDVTESDWIERLTSLVTDFTGILRPIPEQPTPPSGTQRPSDG